MTFEELEAGFLVCLVPLALSAFIFGMKWLVTLKNLVVFLLIFKKLFEVKDLEQANHSKVMKIRFAAWQETRRKQQLIEIELAARIKIKRDKRFYMLSV